MSKNLPPTRFFVKIAIQLSLHSNNLIYHDDRVGILFITFLVVLWVFGKPLLVQTLCSCIGGANVYL